MMRGMGFKTWAALGAACLLAATAPATTIGFSFSADDGLIFLGSKTDGTGSFTTAGDTGTFSAASLTDFSINGTLNDFTASGSYAFGLADLTSFSATLLDGNVTALAFTTGPIEVSLDGLVSFTDTISLDVAGLEPGNLTATTDGGPFNGDLVLDAAATVPEPASWAMLVAGFGIVGTTLRRRRTAVAFA